MSVQTASKTIFTLEPLPYDYAALEPAISGETLRYHHDKHEAAYVAKLNELIAGTPYESMSLEEIVVKSDGALFNNAAQAWNHKFYFESLSPDAQKEPSGEFAEAVDDNFGSFEGLKEQLTKACTSLFGSGWVWLVVDASGGLDIISEQNAGNPLRHKGLKPLLGIDVWEHAYYIDYRNRRADSIAALWSVIDWKKVGERYESRK
ncbi:MAG: superoxide dismutase [Alistipes sp.]|nr:superoxide dismutase [Alistipes sp.]